MESLLIFGALGGVGRGLVGYVKYFLSYKNVEFSWSYFSMTVGISAAIGFAVVWAMQSAGITFAEGLQINPGMAFIIGYAGGDALENLYKILAKEPILGPFKNMLPR